MPETVLIMKKNFKKTLKNVSFMILILKICFVFGQKKIVVIDAGHGGIDSGALGVNRILEKDVV
jgi:N-acetylmuramoyl-L-alanine amidase